MRWLFRLLFGVDSGGGMDPNGRDNGSCIDPDGG